MTEEEIWLTPEQAAALSDRSLIAIRALIQSTLENSDRRQLLRVVEENQFGTTYLVHRSLIFASDDELEIEIEKQRQFEYVAKLTARIQELESEVEVLRLRASTVRNEPVRPMLQQPISYSQQIPTALPPMKASGNVKKDNKDSSGTFWISMAFIILITIVIVLFVLHRQGILVLPISR